MIFDVLANLPRYFPLHQGFGKAMEFLLRPDLRELPVGKYEIDGERVYAMVAQDPGRTKEEASLETHEKYIDIQLVLAGTDTMGWKSKTLCTQPTGDYDPNEDIRFYTDQPDAWFATTSGTFAIFFPEDAHMPLISPWVIHKVVIKVAVAAV